MYRAKGVRSGAVDGHLGLVARQVERLQVVERLAGEAVLTVAS